MKDFLSMTISAKTIRAALDHALREADAVTDNRRERRDHGWAEADTATCSAHNEGQYCCIDPGHRDYDRMVDDVAARIARELGLPA